MVGGTGVGLSQIGDVVLLNVKDNTYGDECAVRCEAVRYDDRRRVRVMLGDQVWWQCVQ